MKKKRGLLLGIAVTLILVYILDQSELLAIRDIDLMANRFRSYGWLAIGMTMLFIVIQQIVTFMPFLLLATVNVMLYGLWWGFLLSWISSLLGALIAFILARYFLNQWIERKWGRKKAYVKINKQLEKSGFFYVLMGRLFPIMPSNLINFGAGASQIPIQAYSFATFIGNVPFVFICSLMGYDLLHFETNQARFTYVSIGLAVFVIINLIVKYYVEKRKETVQGEKV